MTLVKSLYTHHKAVLHFEWVFWSEICRFKICFKVRFVVRFEVRFRLRFRVKVLEQKGRSTNKIGQKQRIIQLSKDADSATEF